MEPIVCTNIRYGHDRFPFYPQILLGTPIFLDHHETRRPLGRAYPTHRSPDGQRQFGVLRFPPPGYSAATDGAVADIEAGLLTALSLHSDVDRTAPRARKNAEGDWTYPRIVVREVSLVARGANPDCHVLLRPENILRAVSAEMLADVVLDLRKALVAEIVKDVVLPEVRRAYTRMSGRLD